MAIPTINHGPERFRRRRTKSVFRLPHQGVTTLLAGLEYPLSLSEKLKAVTTKNQVPGDKFSTR
jgi:hypothetical protein